jgi:hypothetical protein
MCLEPVLVHNGNDVTSYEPLKQCATEQDIVFRRQDCLLSQAFLISVRNILHMECYTTLRNYAVEVNKVTTTLTFMGSVHRRYISKYKQQDVTSYNVFISVKCPTCFRRFLRPSSGAQKLFIQHRVIVKPLLLPVAIVEELELDFYTFPSITNKMQRYTIYLFLCNAVPPPITRNSKLYIQHWVIVKPLLLPAAIMEEMELDFYTFPSITNKMQRYTTYLFL